MKLSIHLVPFNPSREEGKIVILYLHNVLSLSMPWKSCWEKRRMKQNAKQKTYRLPVLWPSWRLFSLYVVFQCQSGIVRGRNWVDKTLVIRESALCFCLIVNETTNRWTPSHSNSFSKWKKPLKQKGADEADLKLYERMRKIPNPYKNTSFWSQERKVSEC